METPLFDTMLVQPQVQDVAEVEKDEDYNEVPAAPSPPSPIHEPSPPPQEHIPSPPQTCATLTKKVVNLEQDKISQALGIFKLKQRVKKLEKKRKSKSSRRMHPNRGKITKLDADEDVTLVDVDTAVKMDADTQRRMEEDVNAVKEVNATEPTVFDDKEFKVEAIQVKYPLIDWEIYLEGSITYWRMIRVGRLTQSFQSFEDMLKDFDRDDLDALWRITKEKFST
uniref:Uncharacterized protein n=1 Tax=Tanacetum cinerariifolium TaxID=118510 RepID=A0A6L2JBT1_TANCI|nr:hypothetical protein [Tanacetum cinerariifolium]